MSAFKVNPVKRPIDAEKLAAFTEGAEEHRATATPQDKSSAPTSQAAPEKQTESILFRLTKSQLDQLNFVFENTNVKSKQKLLESIILPELERRAKAIS